MILLFTSASPAKTRPLTTLANEDAIFFPAELILPTEHCNKTNLCTGFFFNDSISLVFNLKL